MSGVVCILGASGFIGERALRRLRVQGHIRVRVLAHQRPIGRSGTLEVVQGDATDGAALDKLFEPNAVVLNFAYGGDSGSERLARSLAGACVRRRVQRLVHVSTCSVYGNIRGEWIDEESPCNPASSYERAKFATEAVLLESALNSYEIAVVRPTAVFGPGGKNLESLALRVMTQPWTRRYLRATLMNRRRMHAVDVECVASAVLFVAFTPLAGARECFVVSQDEERENNYAALEEFFVRRFSVNPYPFEPLPMPAFALRMALRFAGRSDIEPYRRYSSAKLQNRGFRSPRSFREGLEEYAAWIERLVVR